MNTDQTIPEALQAMKTIADNAAAKRREYAQDKEAQKKDIAYNAVTEHQTLLLKQGIWHSCANCYFFREVPMTGRTMQCTKYKATPPPHIIVHGCRDWEDVHLKDFDDDIPF